MQQAKSNKSILRVLSMALALLLTVSTLGTYSAATAVEAIKGTSVTLGSEISVNFYAEVEDAEAAQMTFRVGGTTKEVPVTQAQHVEGNLYAFPCTIAPAQMTENVEATLSDSGNTYSKSTSVRAYAEKLLVSKQWDKLAAVNMMIATLNYGAAAQSHFGYNPQALANAGYEKAVSAQLPAAEPTIASGSVSGIAFYGASLVFESKIAVRFYFTTTEDIASFDFSIGNDPVAKNDMYYVEIPEINPQDYANDITLTVSKGAEELSVTYSPMRYISRMYGKTDSETLKILLGNLYEYHQTAVEYLADPYGNDKDNLVIAQ